MKSKTNSIAAIREEFGVYLSAISKDDLICSKCKNATESVTTCNNYTRRKPNSAFYNQCAEFVKKN